MKINSICHDWVEDEVLIVGAINAMSARCGSHLTWGFFFFFTQSHESFKPHWKEAIGAMPVLRPAWMPCPGAQHRWHERNPELWRKTQGIHLGAYWVASWWNKLNVHTTSTQHCYNLLWGFLSSCFIIFYALFSFPTAANFKIIGDMMGMNQHVWNSIISLLTADLSFSPQRSQVRWRNGQLIFRMVRIFSFKAMKKTVLKVGKKVLINEVIHLFNQTWHGGLYLHIYSTVRTLCQSP